MKNLLFLLISFFCLAGNAQEKTDSLKVVELAKVLQEKTEQNKKLMEENKKIQKENENLLEIVFLKFKKLISRTKVETPDRTDYSRNKVGTKAENRTEPVEEIEVYDGADTVRAGWIYRLFHKNDYYLKRYKIVNNEKVYLD
ncbi:DUF2113 domain-containing protein [Chryseobacterium sp. SN22]|uniref:DUF2113 family protein n=1 Tax=Chryseobacterium sp. SN22 TaxID=2606431 RepID=UPI0011EF3F2C|nr:DUF2113 family protein [Chryseobacterium sp. SN22]KAA0126435.1 DUF2113 domain-containing protein [Chryseobacterium sp. SN22]